jgi:hypothetical protein
MFVVTLDPAWSDGAVGRLLVQVLLVVSVCCNCTAGSAVLQYASACQGTLSSLRACVIFQTCLHLLNVKTHLIALEGHKWPCHGALRHRADSRCAVLLKRHCFMSVFIM